jgi:hypothetical protein
MSCCSGIAHLIAKGAGAVACAQVMQAMLMQAMLMQAMRADAAQPPAGCARQGHAVAPRHATRAAGAAPQRSGGA